MKIEFTIGLTCTQLYLLKHVLSRDDNNTIHHASFWCQWSSEANLECNCTVELILPFGYLHSSVFLMSYLLIFSPSYYYVCYCVFSLSWLKSFCKEWDRQIQCWKSIQCSVITRTWFRGHEINHLGCYFEKYS